jgi:tetratricopeptide (TPR) repeat protein
LEQFTSKPRMIYFRWSMENYPEYAKRLFDRAILDGLTEFFEVVTIGENCDYSEVCGRYRPDIVLFESGNNGYQDPPLRITNTKAFPEIPKIGLLRSDTFCASRTIFLSDMDRWGVETFFTYQTATAEYLPEISDQVFIWPFFVNTDIYYDYGENKIIPILLTGNTEILQYEWRRRMRQIVGKAFQCLIMPHLDYAGGNASRALHDEKFGRLLNASFFVPTCGAMNKIVVNKHLEIPACKACLVTEKTPALEAFGFVDMENCVFADEQDIVDKITYLFDNPDILQKITENGYELVRTRHTVKQRSQIREWYELNKLLKPGQKIVQTGWFEPLQIVDEYTSTRNWRPISSGTDRNLLQRGDELLLADNYDEAGVLYKQCLEYVAYMPEPKLRIALCCLYKGEPIDAYLWLGQNIKLVQSWNGLDPDPIEWGYLLIILLCLGKMTEAIEFAKAFSSLHRVELDRARWMVFAAADFHEEMVKASSYVNTNPTGFRKSVHQLPERTFKEAVQDWCKILKACNKHFLVSKILGKISG